MENSRRYNSGTVSRIQFKHGKRIAHAQKRLFWNFMSII